MHYLVNDSSANALSVCFVSLYSYGLFNQSVDFRFGGAEVRSFLFGTALSQMPGYHVSFVVMDHKQRKVERYGKIEVYRHSHYGKQETTFYKRLNNDLTGYIRKREHFPYIEIHEFSPALIVKLPLFGSLFLARKLLSISKSNGEPPAYMIDQFPVTPDKVRIYHEIDADVYCIFGTSNLAGEVAAYCRDAGKKFVLFLASDHNLNGMYKVEDRSQNVYGDYRFVCEYAIQEADLIFAQTEYQQRLLLEQYGKKGIVVRNPIDLSSRIKNVPDYSERRYALWVGRADPHFKRPMMLIELAKRAPEIEFLMVMNPHTSNVVRQVNEAKPDNVTILDHVPFSKIDELFAKSFVLVNTSVMEGFPNTFLQAGKYAVPILSLQVDPDGFIEENDCGIVAKGDFDSFVEGLRIIWHDPEIAGLYSRNIRSHIETRHSLARNVQIVDENLQAIYSSG